MNIKKINSILAGEGVLTFIKFAIVAFTTVTVELSAYTILFHAIKLDPVISSPIGQVIGLIVNFTLNKIYTFDKSKTSSQLEFMKYLIIWLINLAFSTIMIKFLIAFLPNIFPTILRFVIICFAFVFNFFAMKYFVFRSSK